MNNNEIINPNLTEIGFKSFLNITLKKCKDFKMNYFNAVYNIFLFIFFLLLLITILFIKYKGKMTNEEIERKEQEKRNYVLSKIAAYQENKLKQQQILISGLPHY